MIHQYWDVKHIRNGEVIWEETYKQNSLANQGASAILQLFYRKATLITLGSNTYSVPTNFYVRLCNYSPLVTDTLLSIQNEPTRNFYGAQVVPASTAGFPVLDVSPDGNPRLTSAIVTFSASGGNIGPVTNAFLATTGGTTDPVTGVFTPDNTGFLVGFLPLSIQRTIIAGDSMTYQFYAEEGNS